MIKTNYFEISRTRVLFTAQKLWEKRDDERRLLLRAAHDAMGGVEGALAKHADGVLEALEPAELAAARELLLRLVTPERTRRVGGTPSGAAALRWSHEADVGATRIVRSHQHRLFAGVADAPRWRRHAMGRHPARCGVHAARTV